MKLNLLLALPSLASALAYNPFRLPDFKPTRTSPTVQKRADTWGGAVSLGPSKSTITRAVTTLVPGAAPSTQNGELFLWPGMSNGTGDLVQTTLESWAEGNSWCGATAGQWCIRCSLFGSFGQLDGDASPVSGDMKVEILYELLSDGQTWKQTATDLGTKKQLSTFSHKSGPYMTYTNTVITLAAADATFGKTISTSNGATYTGLTNSGNGKVWTIASMHIPKM
ncbi:hypothetical protein SLS59_008282 [Nothophoma quercina]|uniref:Uncharacterized protein n=1 Tax=Nothophoma quercina TaxID=749835 RepID=A0ABR3QT82_9PLEO